MKNILFFNTWTERAKIDEDTFRVDFLKVIPEERIVSLISKRTV